MADTGAKAQNLAHTGIIVDHIEQVDQWYDYLLENGVSLINQAKTHRDGARSFYCKDPENVVVQFIYHPPISKG